MCLVYVNDYHFFGMSVSEIDEAISELRKPKPYSFDLEEESDVARFLEILLGRDEDKGTIELK